MRIRRCAALAVALASLASPAAAAPASVAECKTAADGGQELRDRGKLIEAQREFVTCAKLECPNVIRQDCLGWLEAAGATIPTVALTVRDPEGQDVTDYELAVDGVFEAVSPGRLLPLNPGVHRITVRARGFETAGVPVTAREGEQRRLLHVTLKRPVAPARPAAAGGGPHWPSLALFGAGAVGFGVASYFFLSARSDLSDLRASCRGTCADEAILDSARAKATVADVAFGVAVVAVVTATVLWWIRPGSSHASVAPAAIRF